MTYNSIDLNCEIFETLVNVQSLDKNVEKVTTDLDTVKKDLIAFLGATKENAPTWLVNDVKKGLLVLFTILHGMLLKSGGIVEKHNDSEWECPIYLHHCKVFKVEKPSKIDTIGAVHDIVETYGLPLNDLNDSYFGDYMDMRIGHAFLATDDTQVSNMMDVKDFANSIYLTLNDKESLTTKYIVKIDSQLFYRTVETIGKEEKVLATIERLCKCG